MQQKETRDIKVTCVWRQLPALTLSRIFATMTEFLRMHIAIVGSHEGSANRIPLSSRVRMRTEKECETVENIRRPCRLINASEWNPLAP